MRRPYWPALLLLLPSVGAHAGAYPLNTYAVYDDQSTDPNDIGHMYLYTGNYSATSFQVNSVSQPNTNINSGGVAAAGTNVGPYQPAVNISPFSESYFQISSSNPMNGVIEDPLFIDGNDQDTFINAADTNTYVGTVFMTWLRSCSGCGNDDFGDDLAVINSGATALTATVREWAGTPPAGAWGAVLVTSPSIPAGGVWMWSPDTAANGNPVNESGGTLASQAGNYQVQLGGSGLCYFGDDFTDYQGSGSNRNDLAHMMPDMNTGRFVGTDLIGPNDWRNDGCGGSNDADMIITNEDPAATANFTIERLVSTTAGAQWPVSALLPGSQWVNTDVVNQTLAPNASYYWSNDSTSPQRQWATFFRVVSNNGVPIGAWGGAQPLVNNFDGGGYMDSADQQAPWGSLFKWGLVNGSGSGAGAPEVFYAVAPTNNTTVTLNTNSGTLTTTSPQSNTSGGPAGLRFVLSDSACPDDYFASASANQNFYSFVVSQALSNPSGGGEQAYSIPPPNLSQLVVSKTASPPTANVGGTVTYTLVATNYSRSAMTDARVWDTLPTNLPATFSLSSYTVAGGSATETNPSTGYYLWSIGTIPAGQSVTITVDTTVQSGALNGEVVPNVAMGDNSTDQPFSSQNAPVTIVIPGLNLQKLVSPTSASPGDTVTYTLNYYNNCPAAASPPNLSLEVQASSLGTTNMQYNFEVINNGTTAVNMDEVQIVYWLYDPGLPTADITPNDYYGGNSTPNIAGWNAPNWSAVVTATSPILRPDNRDSDLEVTWSSTTNESLPGGVTDGPIQLDLELESAPPDFIYTNQYSYQSTTLTGFAGDANFALYYDGQLVSGCTPTNWVTVYDTIPSQITYVGSSPSATVSGGVVSWFDSCIQCQATQQYTWWGTVNSGATCSISDQADFTSNTVVGVSNLVTVVVPCGTSSPTATATATRTPTDTPSATATATPSRSPTSTPSPSPTATATPSDTPTPTQSQTLSATPTATATRSATPTPTQSLTWTATPTPSATPSDTPSPTQSLTWTATPTPSATPSDTPSPTQSLTWTATPTPSATPSDTPSPTQSLTWTATPTPSATPSDTPSPTQSLTWTVTPTPSATPSATPSPTQSSTWTASPTASETRTVTPTATPTPSYTDSPTITVSPTITPTPLPAPVHLTVTLFNAAGEVVETLYQGNASSVPGSLGLSAPLLVEGSSNFQLELGTTLPNGQSGLAWSGLNANGQEVGSGVYYVQTKYTNGFGQVTTYTKSLQVLAAASGEGISIFNSAGELVWWSALPAGGAGTGSISLNQNALALAYNPSTGTLLKSLVIQMQDGGSVTWNGLSEQGLPVRSGSYSVQAISENAGGTPVFVNKTVVLLASGEGAPSAEVRAAPNPWQSGRPLELSYTPYPGYQGACALYTLTGQLAARGLDASGSGTIRLEGAGLASGIYVLEFSQQQGSSVVARSLTKIAVVR